MKKTGFHASVSQFSIVNQQKLQIDVFKTEKGTATLEARASVREFGIDVLKKRRDKKSVVHQLHCIRTPNV